MKVTYALLGLAGLAGLAGAAKSFLDLGNGMYTIPYVNNTMDIGGASRDAYEFSDEARDDKPSASASVSEKRGVPGTCVPQFPTRTTFCRTRTIRRADYLLAYSKFLDWIETGPDEGWIPKHSCKSLVWGSVVVSACSTGGRNPTCRGELVEAMREIDTYCAPDAGGDIQIKKWLKTYSRHHVRDGDGLHGMFSAVTSDLGLDEDTAEAQDGAEEEEHVEGGKKPPQ